MTSLMWAEPPGGGAFFTARISMTNWRERRLGAGTLCAPARRPSGYSPRDQAEKLEPQPQVCFAFGFLNENPLCPNWPST